MLFNYFFPHVTCVNIICLLINFFLFYFVFSILHRLKQIQSEIIIIIIIIMRLKIWTFLKKVLVLFTLKYEDVKSFHLLVAQGNTSVLFLKKCEHFYWVKHFCSWSWSGSGRDFNAKRHVISLSSFFLFLSYSPFYFYLYIFLFHKFHTLNSLPPPWELGWFS